MEFRHEVIELDGKRCKRCGRNDDEVVLQVHHEKYRPGKLPWEYSYEDCETLCKGCHAAEHGKIRPKTGWDYVGEYDLGDLLGSCELCGTSIRYEFTVHHRNWEPLIVGTVCCDYLTGTNTATDVVESKKRTESRLARFIQSKRWKKSSSGESIKQKGIDVFIQRLSGGRGYCVHMDTIPGKRSYSTIDEAKEQVFRSIDSGAAQKYIRLAWEGAV